MPAAVRRLATIDRITDLIASGDAMRHLADTPSWMEMDLTFGQLRLLHLLAHQGQLSIGQIAERFGVSLTAASQFADRVERQGLVQRQHRSDDRRVVECSLTETGRNLVASMMGMQRESFRDLFGVLSEEELDQLERLLRAIVERLATRDPSTASPTGSPTGSPSGMAG